MSTMLALRRAARPLRQRRRGDGGGAGCARHRPWSTVRRPWCSQRSAGPRPASHLASSQPGRGLLPRLARLQMSRPWPASSGCRCRGLGRRLHCPRPRRPRRRRRRRPRQPLAGAAGAAARGRRMPQPGAQGEPARSRAPARTPRCSSMRRARLLHVTSLTQPGSRRGHPSHRSHWAPPLACARRRPGRRRVGARWIPWGASLARRRPRAARVYRAPRRALCGACAPPRAPPRRQRSCPRCSTLPAAPPRGTAAAG
mmetsp:Transcript_18932/g.72240  ORF Transcript_18932/g.72240 Transcript_18932/m.72240 type:complete len:256 (+) Transcript_18932:1526-2293(+)